MEKEHKEWTENIQSIDIPEENMERYFSINNAAKFLDMHPNTIRNFIRRGMLHAFQIGDSEKVYVLQSEVKALVKPIDDLGNMKWRGKTVYG